MHADAVLPPDVRPERAACERPRVALLTGATGFLGRYALRALLRETDLHLVCLVRAGDDTQARSRLDDVLARAGVTQPAQIARVQACRGDIAEARLGLDAPRYAALTRDVHVVYHCAAEVNWARSYRRLRAVNVLGALEVLRFACAQRAKPLVFVSTIAVCFAAGHEAVVDEDSDLLMHIDAMPLGYAQSKCVAESLLRQAFARGLPVTILRPALISGDSVTGEANLDDLIAALVEGCTAAGAAMDADWLLDCVPVDFVADVLARLPLPATQDLQVMHLVHDKPRHWREVVLWMNLYGCPVRLMPTREWLDASFDGKAIAGSRLHGYRRFFQGRRAETTARPFEAYLEAQQRRVASHRTLMALGRLGLSVPPLDAPLMHRYFERYRNAGLLPPGITPAESVAAMTTLDFEAMLRARTGDAAVRVVAATHLPFDSANGIINEISSARLGGNVGLRRHVLVVTCPERRMPLRFDVLAKTKAPDEVVEALTVELAVQCDPSLGALVDAHRSALGLKHSHERELALYELRDARLRRHSPRCFGTLRDRPRKRWTVLLEYVHEVDPGEVSAGLDGWNAERLDAVIQGLAAIQSTSGAPIERLRSDGTLAAERPTDQMLALLPLWRGLAAYAGRCYVGWSPALPALQERLLAECADWWPAVLAMPHTLIHNDFNPRNLVLRNTPDGLRLCAFDWELATFGLPQRDLAEFLCWVAGERSMDGDFIASQVEQHRRALAAATGLPLDPTQWRAGFVLALQQFLLTRLPMYTLMQRFRPQAFLPRLVRDAERLHRTVRHWLPEGRA